ncbi:MAG: LysM peptidoglycan-binding domain-containing protein, partial [Pseudomonadota bacterium]
MLRIKGPVSMPARSTTVAVLGCVSLVSGVAACSADVTRFDRSLLETSSTGSTHSSTNNAPMTLSAQSPGDTYSGVRFSEQRDPVSRRSLAPTPVASTPAKLPPVSTINASPSRTTTASGTSRPIKVADASPYTGGATLNDGSYGRDTITVERGDTLYGLARRHRVSVSALKSTNGLTTNVIRPGQTLALPASDAATGSSRPVLPPQTRPVTATAPADGTY